MKKRPIPKVKTQRNFGAAILGISLLFARCGCGGGSPSVDTRPGCDQVISRQQIMDLGGTYDPVDKAWYNKDGLVGYAVNQNSIIYIKQGCAGF